MALPEVDDLHQTLMEFAERTNELVCSANSKLEALASNHLHSTDISADNMPSSEAALEGRANKRTRLSEHLKETLSPSQAPTLRPRLPNEILDDIFFMLSPRHLLPVLLTNSCVSPIAKRRFYHSVTLDSPLKCAAFLRKMMQSKELSGLVRSLEVSLAHTSGKSRAELLRRRRRVSAGAPGEGESVPPPSDAPSPSSGITLAPPPLLTRNFYLLFQRALRSMPTLLSLTLELPKSHSPLWIFSGCTFRLKQFTTSMHCHRPLALFLETQNNIEDLTLRGFQSESLLFMPFLGAAAAAMVTFAVGAPPPNGNNNGVTLTNTIQSKLSSSPHAFTLDPLALPRLKTFNAIHAGPSIIHTVMSSRPIQFASIPLFPDLSLSTLDALESGSVPLRRLSVISFDPGAPNFLFEELAKRFVDLEALHLVMLMADYTGGMLEESAKVLGNFRSLKYITFMAATNDDSADAVDEGKIAKQWHLACPTLRTIILPRGRVWFHGEDDFEIQVGEPQGTVEVVDLDARSAMYDSEGHLVGDP